MSSSDNQVSFIHKLILDTDTGLKPYLEKCVDLENIWKNFKSVGKSGGQGGITVHLHDAITTVIEVEHSEHFNLEIIQPVSVNLLFGSKAEVWCEWSIQASELQTILDTAIVKWSIQSKKSGLIEESVEYLEGKSEYSITENSVSLTRIFDLVYLLKI